MDCPVLRSGGLVLDLPVLDDASAWRAAHDSEVVRWFEFPGRPALDDVRRHLVHVRHQWTDELPERTWAMREGGDFAGMVDVRRRGDQRVNVSYFVAPEHRGHGLGATAVRLVAAWVLSEWPTPAVVGVVDEA